MEMSEEEAVEAERKFHEQHPLHQPVRDLQKTMRAWNWRSITIWQDGDPEIYPMPK
jgi:hypothetical protein